MHLTVIIDYVLVSTDPVWYYFPSWMLSQNRAMWSRRQRVQEVWLPKAFVSSDGIWNLPITSLPVDNFNVRAVWCKPTGINYNMHGWIFCRYCATGWFWWISGLRAVATWSSSSFTKTLVMIYMMKKYIWLHMMCWSNIQICGSMGFMINICW